MPEGISYSGSNSTFTGPSNSLVTVGDHAYAFSGVVEVTNANEQILGFTTGKEYLVCKLQVSNGTGSNDDIQYTVKMNDSIVCQFVSFNSSYWEGGLPMHLVIPPYTTVAVHGDNLTGATGRAQTAWVQGKIYK
tara:strand:- start:35 stop:436 length:402 start_codon:yes stop_codon:yes gene_type:complete